MLHGLGRMDALFVAAARASAARARDAAMADRGDRLGGRHRAAARRRQRGARSIPELARRIHLVDHRAGGRAGRVEPGGRAAAGGARVAPHGRRRERAIVGLRRRARQVWERAVDGGDGTAPERPIAPRRAASATAARERTVAPRRAAATAARERAVAPRRAAATAARERAGGGRNCRASEYIGGERDSRHAGAKEGTGGDESARDASAPERTGGERDRRRTDTRRRGIARRVGAANRRRRRTA